MNLDFSMLSGPRVAPSQRPGSAVSTAMTARSPPGGGRSRHGQVQEARARQVTNPAVPPARPQLSPVRPQPPTDELSNEIKASPPSPLVPAFSAGVDSESDAEREAFEERAGIMEFDGGMSREQAEEAARDQVAARRSRFG